MKWASKRYMGVFVRKFALFPQYDNHCKCTIWMQWYYYDQRESAHSQNSCRCPECVALLLLRQPSAESTSEERTGGGAKQGGLISAEMALRKLQYEALMKGALAPCSPNPSSVKDVPGLAMELDLYKTKYPTAQV